MSDPASKREGGSVVMVSSLDDQHPGDNIIDGNGNTYWTSTGLYPQEIVLQLGTASKINTVQMATTNVKCVRVEGCAEETPVNFKLLCEGELEEKQGQLQHKDIACHADDTFSFVKLTILSGWSDFCSIHKVSVA
eukprot:TRINITY_DN12437_c0_g1_i1.p3 TRINITY_DN12437_c0_g1~~TRINITY_DN12437_c0_g1_i1.p3  ORF type:complete len:135 (-),score=34.97 TRINITY_DN12437_c0_g1_i1:127-531(-)